MAAKRAHLAIVRYAHRPRRRSRVGTLIHLTMIAGLAPMASDVVSGYQAAGAMGALDHLSLCTTGITRHSDGSYAFQPMYALTRLYLPMFGAMLAHKMANRVGINRVIRKSGIPLFEL